MAPTDDDTDTLLARVASGRESAAEVLLERHRRRLTTMVRLRMDRRMAARLDPSDVVQDALADAYKKLRKFAATRPLPFYPWLRGIAWERLVQLHRQHVGAERRSVKREEAGAELSQDSELLLADRLAASASGSKRRAMRDEIRDRVRAAIRHLSPPAQEIVILRHLEELPFKEITAVLGLSEAAVYSRYRRAMEQLSRLLKSEA
jgi:RNA polymerase sigma-70 factor (ECF subfamily)